MQYNCNGIGQWLLYKSHKRPHIMVSSIPYICGKTNGNTKTELKKTEPGNIDRGGNTETATLQSTVLMESSVSDGGGSHRIGLDESYGPLPSLYLTFSLIWLVSACTWTVNTFKKRHFQSNNLQWTLASVPLVKALQLVLSFLFWYSCYNFRTCSLWMSFGVYVTGVLFQTSSFVSFLLISHGYCITCERLSLNERRSTAALGCVFYLTLVGYRASVPYFTVLLLLNYFVSFYVIFHHISQNLLALREQLSFIETEDVHAMHDAVYAKYTMFKKFQGAMQIVALAETMIYMNMDDSVENYWFRLIVREVAQFCIFMYIGWIFRSQDLAPRFSVMPAVKCKGETQVPPIFSVEMDAATFKDFSRHEWHIGVSTSPGESSKDVVLVIIQQPDTQRLRPPDANSPCSTSSSLSALDINLQRNSCHA